MDTTAAAGIAISLAIGLIVGVERGFERRRDSEGQRVAGLRTFGFVGLLGGVCALLAGELGWPVLAAGLLAVALLVAVSYRISAERTGDLGLTTEVALVLTFVLGALPPLGHAGLAVAAAVVMAALLGAKRTLHESLAVIEPREMAASLQLLLIALVVLPLLPDRGLGPYDAVNPRSVGMLVLLIAGLSFAGYVAVRVIGPRAGLLATAVLGGLTASTAVTVAFARLGRLQPNAAEILGAGIGLSSATMAARLAVVVGIVNPALLPRLALPLGVLTAVPLLAAALLARRARPAEGAEIGFRNPLELEVALLYGVVLSVLFVLVRAAEAWLGAGGVYGVSALSGLFDVDAVSISLAGLSRDALALDLAAAGVAVAAISNTLSKAALALWIGRWPVGRWTAAILLPSALLAAAALWLS